MTSLTVTSTPSHSPPSAIPTDQVAAIINSMDVSENTRIQYLREIRVFLGWLGDSSLNQNTLLDFKKWLKARSDISAGTKSKYLAVSRTFLRELYRLAVIPVDITANVKGIKTSRLHKKTPISDDEIARVFEYLDSDAADTRARVIIGLMYFQGFRRVEVCRLSVEDFSPAGNTLLVRGKGQDDTQSVDLHPRMVAILTNYLTAANLKSGPLLPSRESTTNGLCSSMIWRIAIGVHRKLGLDGRNLHSYRKAFVTKLIRTGLPLLDVASYSRHASLEMLNIYYHRMEKTKTLPTYYEAFSA